MLFFQIIKKGINEIQTFVFTLLFFECANLQLFFNNQILSVVFLNEYPKGNISLIK